MAHPLLCFNSSQPPFSSPVALGIGRRPGPSLHSLVESVREVLINVQYSPIGVYINHEDGEDIVKTISRPLKFSNQLRPIRAGA